MDFYKNIEMVRVTERGTEKKMNYGKQQLNQSVGEFHDYHMNSKNQTNYTEDI